MCLDGGLQNNLEDGVRELSFHAAPARRSDHSSKFTSCKRVSRRVYTLTTTTPLAVATPSDNRYEIKTSRLLCYTFLKETPPNVNYSQSDIWDVINSQIAPLYLNFRLRRRYPTIHYIGFGHNFAPRRNVIIFSRGAINRGKIISLVGKNVQTITIVKINVCCHLERKWKSHFSNEKKSSPHVRNNPNKIQHGALKSCLLLRKPIKLRDLMCT